MINNICSNTLPKKIKLQRDGTLTFEDVDPLEYLEAIFSYIEDYKQKGEDLYL